MILFVNASFTPLGSAFEILFSSSQFIYPPTVGSEQSKQEKREHALEMQIQRVLNLLFGLFKMFNQSKVDMLQHQPNRNQFNMCEAAHKIKMCPRAASAASGEREGMEGREAAIA